jgi:hypothetical protein
MVLGAGFEEIGVFHGRDGYFKVISALQDAT